MMNIIVSANMIKEHIEWGYLELAKYIFNDGIEKDDRTGTGTFSLFGKNLTHDYKFGFPLLTTKKIHYKSVIYELLWILKGDTNVKYLQDNGVRIWDEWADKNGNLGPIYGKQMRDCGGVDQLLKTVEGIKKDPNSRRHVISLWHPPDVDKGALACCHGTVIQFYVRGQYLDIAAYQRSADFFLGLPFNIASYSFFLYMMCEVLGYKPGKMYYSLGDVHIYKNHTNQVVKQITRDPRDLPILRFGRQIENIEDFHYEDFLIEGYSPYPAIKAKVSV